MLAERALTAVMRRMNRRYLALRAAGVHKLEAGLKVRTVEIR